MPGFSVFLKGYVGGGGVKWFMALGLMLGARPTALILGLLALAALALFARSRLRPMPPIFKVPSTPVLLAALAVATAVERSPLLA